MDQSRRCQNSKFVVTLIVLKEVPIWLSEHYSVEDVVVTLQQRTIPTGYLYNEKECFRGAITSMVKF